MQVLLIAFAVAVGYVTNRTSEGTRNRPASFFKSFYTANEIKLKALTGSTKNQKGVSKAPTLVSLLLLCLLLPIAVGSVLIYFEKSPVVASNVFEVLVHVVAILFGFSIIGIMFVLDRAENQRRDWVSIMLQGVTLKREWQRVRKADLDNYEDKVVHRART